MTPPKPRTAATPPPVEALDPLADLRQDETDDLTATQDAPAEPAATALFTGTDQTNAVATAVATWHADTVSQGFLHKGGACGCHYLASLAVTATMPLAPVYDDDTMAEV